MEYKSWLELLLHTGTFLLVWRESAARLYGFVILWALYHRFCDRVNNGGRIFTLDQVLVAISTQTNLTAHIFHFNVLQAVEQEAECHWPDRLLYIQELLLRHWLVYQLRLI